MILDTHNNAKVVTHEYQRTLAIANIARDRVGEEEYAWLDVPPAIGNGAYDNEARGWMANPDHYGAEHRYTPMDGPNHKGVEP